MIFCGAGESALAGMREDLDEETMVDIGMRQEASHYHTNGGADGIGSGDAVAVLSEKSLPHPG